MRTLSTKLKEIDLVITLAEDNHLREMLKEMKMLLRENLGRQKRGKGHKLKSLTNHQRDFLINKTKEDKMLLHSMHLTQTKALQSTVQ